ncbi:MAG TPA: hypothetical protein VE153_14235 [Myxococcus sp.]|nr:hypothetical protein [Myxococcus sp.]
MAIRLSRGGSNLSFQYVSGRFIQLADSEPVAFPGPLRALALTRDEELLVIRHNLRAVANAVSKATGPVTPSELPRRPPKVKLPLPDIAYNRQLHLKGELPGWMDRPTRAGAKKPRTSTPKSTVSGLAKKPGSKSPRK